MKAIKNIFLVAFVATLSVVCVACYASKDMRSKEDKVIKTCQIAYFSKVDITSFADVKFVQGKDVSMRIEGPKDLVDKVEYEQRGETLVISHKPDTKRRGNFIFGNYDNGLTIYLSSPDLTSVNLVGSGSFIVDGSLDTDVFDAELKGSGDIVFNDVVCDNFTTNLRGSGDVNIQKVNGRNVTLALFGSGDFNVKKVEAEKADVSLRGSGDMSAVLNRVGTSNVALFGSGDMSVHFVDCGTAECQLYGSGDLVLKGNLRSVNKRTTGSGDIHDGGLTVNSAAYGSRIEVK